MMELLGLLMYNMTPVVEPRDQLYYGQWSYCITWHFPVAHFLRTGDLTVMDRLIKWRNLDETQTYYKEKVTQLQQAELHRAHDYLKSRPNPYKKVVSANTIWFYTNTPNDFADIDSIATGKLLSTVVIDVCLPLNTLLRKNPTHKVRTYFKGFYLDSVRRENLKKYFATRANTFRLSPSFRELVYGKRLWTADHFFVDHNDQRDAFLINLACPGIIRKTMPIQAK